MVRQVKSLEELGEFVANFLSILDVGDRSLVLGLRGDLGSGKTTFVQELIRQLGVNENITSPTFIIQKRYLLPENSKFQKVFHLDAYRLSSGKDLLKIGFQETLKENKTLILIEWPENVLDVLPKDTKYLDFKFIDPTTREISYGKE